MLPDAGRRYSNALLQLGSIITEKERSVLMIEKGMYIIEGNVPLDIEGEKERKQEGEMERKQEGKMERKQEGEKDRGEGNQSRLGARNTHRSCLPRGLC